MRYRTLTVVIVLCLWGLATHGTHAGSGDEPHYLAIAHSLAFDGDLDLANNYGRNEPLIAGGTLEAGEHVRPGRGGVLRPVHDIGLPLTFAPYVRLVRPLVTPLLSRPDHPVLKRLRLSPSTAYRHLLSAATIIIAVLLARLMMTVFVAVGSPPSTAFWTTLLVALSPPLLIFSILLFTELTSALLCLFVFRRIAFRRSESARGWMLAGAAAGFLLLVHVRNVGLVVPLATLALVHFWRHRTISPAVAFFGPLAVGVAVRTFVNYGFWGTYVTNPHARTGEFPGLVETLQIAVNRLGGMLLDQEFGLLPYAPIFLLAAFGAIVLWRDRRMLLLQLSVVIGFYVLLICLPFTNAHGWMGGWNPAARFLTPIVPLLAIAVNAAMVVVPRVVVAPVLILQIAISAYVWQNPKDLWNDGDGIAAACRRVPEAVCQFLPSFPVR